MKSRLLFLPVLLGIIFLTSCTKDEDQDITVVSEKSQQNTEIISTDISDIQEQESPSKQIITGGTYANYTPELIWNSENTLLFFHAPWCPSCVALEKEITSSPVPQWLTILKVDYDTEIELRQKYEVTSQHTFVQIDKNSELIQKWVWANSIEDISERIRKDKGMEEAMMKTEEVMKENSEKTIIQDDVMTEEWKEEQEVIEETDEAMIKQVGEYALYNDSLVGIREHTVIFFHANWCPSCRAADSAITTELENIPANLNILKADFDTQLELRKKYGVTSQHTFVLIDTEGNEIKKWVGGTGVESIMEKIN